MLRFLLSLLALLVPGLAVLFDRPWLNVATGVLIVGGLGLLGWWLWTTYWAEEPERPRPSPDPDAADPSLEEFGIVDIQPQGASETEPKAQESDDHASPAPAPASSEESSHSGTTAPPASSRAQAEPPSTVPSEQDADRAPSQEDPVFGPLLEALRAALDAHTVCLLVQEEVALTYRIEAVASSHPAVRRSGSFDTQTPLLTATMSREAVTVRPLSSEKVAVEDLGYYTSAPAVDHLAVVPVSQPEASSTTFLLADAPPDADLNSSRAHTLLEHFAETTALFLNNGRSAPEQSEQSARKPPMNGHEPSKGPDADKTSDEDDVPRPRREIIAEEMEAARAAEEELALALVHLNRAESIARRGDEAVTSAEHLFQARLEQLMPNRRIDRFGELTYGIFFRNAADALEPQVAELEATMAQEEGELEGGVSVGVAVWNESDEEPEALRAEATEALREAYETGTPTIVA